MSDVHIGNAPTFTDFDAMIEKTRPELLMVTTVDGFHHEFAIRSSIDQRKPITIADLVRL